MRVDRDDGCRRRPSRRVDRVELVAARRAARRSPSRGRSSAPGRARRRPVPDLDQHADAARDEVRAAAQPRRARSSAATQTCSAQRAVVLELEVVRPVLEAHQVARRGLRAARGRRAAEAELRPAHHDQRRGRSGRGCGPRGTRPAGRRRRPGRRCRRRSAPGRARRSANAGSSLQRGRAARRRGRSVVEERRAEAERDRQPRRVRGRAPRRCRSGGASGRVRSSPTGSPAVHPRRRRGPRAHAARGARAVDSVTQVERGEVEPVLRRRRDAGLVLAVERDRLGVVGRRRPRPGARRRRPPSASPAPAAPAPRSARRAKRRSLPSLTGPRRSSPATCDSGSASASIAWLSARVSLVVEVGVDDEPVALAVGVERRHRRRRTRCRSRSRARVARGDERRDRVERGLRALDVRLEVDQVDVRVALLLARDLRLRHLAEQLDRAVRDLRRLELDRLPTCVCSVVDVGERASSASVLGSLGRAVDPEEPARSGGSPSTPPPGRRPRGRRSPGRGRRSSRRPARSARTGCAPATYAAFAASTSPAATAATNASVASTRSCVCSLDVVDGRSARPRLRVCARGHRGGARPSTSGRRARTCPRPGSTSCSRPRSSVSENLPESPGAMFSASPRIAVAVEHLELGDVVGAVVRDVERGRARRRVAARPARSRRR